MDYNTHRRRIGLFLGIFLGLGFSVTANLINRWAMPTIPVYAPPPGEFWIIVITTLMFGALGLISAWTEESITGVVISGLAGSFISSIWMLIDETSNRLGVFALLVLVFLPRMFFYMPFGALVRWLIYKWDQPTTRVVAPARRLLPILSSFLLLVFFGTFSLYPKETRTSLTRMDTLLKEGMQSQATSRADLTDVKSAVARNATELSALRLKGERDYTEFDINKSKGFERIGDVQVQLKKADTKRQKYTVMILADDNFATIVAAIEEGRTIFANIRKFLRFVGNLHSFKRGWSDQHVHDLGHVIGSALLHREEGRTIVLRRDLEQFAG